MAKDPHSVDEPTGAERARGRYRLARLGVVFGGLNRGISSAAALLRVPLLIWGLELEQYGLYVAILGVVATANLLDFGLHYGVLNAVAEARGRDDTEAVGRIMATAFVIYSSIVVAVSLLALPALAFVPMEWLLGVRPEQATMASRIALLAFLGLLLPMPLKVFSGGLFGFQKQYVVWAFRSMVHVLQLAAIGGAVLWHRGDLMFVVIVTVATDLIHWAVLAVVAVRSQPELRLRLSLASRALAPALTGIGLAFFVTNIANLMKYTLGNAVVSHGLGPEAVPSFSVPLALFFTGMGLAGLAGETLWPAYGEAAARGEWDWVRRAFGLGAKASLGVSGAFAVLGAVFGDVLIDLWTPKDVHVSQLLLLCLAGWLLAQSCFHAGAVLLSGLNRPVVVMSFAVVEGLAVFSASVVLVRTAGVEGVGVAMLVAGTVAAVGMAVFAVPRTTDGRVRWPWRTLGVVLGCMGASAVVGVLLRGVLQELAPFALLLTGSTAVVSVYAVGAWVFLLAPDERERLVAWVGKRVGGRSRAC